MVLQAAANAEAEGTLSAVVFVMAAGTKRNSLSIETIGTILKCSLPDAILANLLVAFSSAPTMAYANEAARVVPFDVLDKNRFNFDNPVFQGPPLKASDPDRALYETMWTATMTQMANIVNAVFRNKPTQAPLFREMLTMRMNIKTCLNDIRMNIANLQAAQRHIDDADASLVAAQNSQDHNKNFIKKETLQEIVKIPCAELNTLCGACQNLCHAGCSLSEIPTKGSSDFCGCAAFQNQPNCLRCKDRCSHTEHLHGRYRFETRETTVEKVLDKLKLKYEAATQSVAAQGGYLTKSQQAKRLIDAAITANVDQLRQCCSGIKKICQRFNIVAEMNVMLNQMVAEKRRIRNLKAANEADTVIQYCSYD